ncbi:MAG: DotU family type IV/VI secretion system protein [Phycisphaeraceae bacterium]|nr:DotU family type IV/VI secretion system protein [Phycisphaeraceae bacterium]
MTLLEVVEPLFQYICRINRSARKGVVMDASRVRAEVQAIFDQMRRDAGSADLGESLERVRLPLVYFVDFMIKESPGGLGREWQEMAHEENMFAGDEHFFDLLDEALKESGKQAADRLAVFYSCLGLGFSGFYVGQPEYLRKKMLEISARIRPMMETDESARLCPEAYDHVDTTNLIQPPGRSVMGIALALVVLIIVLAIGNAYLYLSSSDALRAALDHINEDTSAVTAGGGR